MEKRYCEACGRLMAEMSEQEFEARGGICDECSDKLSSDDFDNYGPTVGPEDFA